MRLYFIISLLFTITSICAQNIALFWNLYEAVARGSRIIHDVTLGVGAVSKAIQAIDIFLDLSGEEEIKKTISENAEEQNKEEEEDESSTESTEESKVEEPIQAELPKFNGCGALGFHIRDDNLPIALLTSCCSIHDICYSASCRCSKRKCDHKLRSCLFSVCDINSLEKSQIKSCRGAAKLLYAGTMILSKQQYDDNQRQLDCPKKKLRIKKYQKRRQNMNKNRRKKEK